MCILLNPHRARLQLVERFGAARDEWIKEDLNSWLAPNRIYDGVADALRSLKAREDVYIVTTKQVHWLATLTDCACEDGYARAQNKPWVVSKSAPSASRVGTCVCSPFADKALHV